MATVAQGYIHLKGIKLAKDPKSLGDELLNKIAEEAAAIYKTPLIVDLKIEEGSIKIWASAFVMLTTFAAQYPDLKTGIKELYSDAKWFGEKSIDLTKEIIKATKENIYHAEKRTMDSGRLFRIQKRIQKIEDNRDILSRDVIRAEMARIEQDLERLIKNFDPKDARFVSDSLLPKKPIKHKPPHIERSIIRTRQLDLEINEQIPYSEEEKTILYQKSTRVPFSLPVGELPDERPKTLDPTPTKPPAAALPPPAPRR